MHVAQVAHSLLLVLVYYSREESIELRKDMLVI